ncbi:OPT family oligopeptide transporter [Methylorubrum suomiense]
MHAPSPPSRHVEITLRGLLLGAAITVVFMAANVYMGLKTGMTFSSSIPAAMIAMGSLRLFGGSGILENNIVQTQASAAGTLCNVILILPGLVLIGHWQGFPFWQTTAVCGIGGLLGVAFSIPLRRALVSGEELPYPEGVAAAEVLRTGQGRPARGACAIFSRRRPRPGRSGSPPPASGFWAKACTGRSLSAGRRSASAPASRWRWSASATSSASAPASPCSPASSSPGASRCRS